MIFNRRCSIEDTKSNKYVAAKTPEITYSYAASLKTPRAFGLKGLNYKH